MKVFYDSINNKQIYLKNKCIILGKRDNDLRFNQQKPMPFLMSDAPNKTGIL